MKNTIKGWVARDKDGRLLFYTDKPWKYEGKSWAISEGDWMEIDKSWYPDVKWEDDEPKRVDVSLAIIPTGKWNPKFEAGDYFTYKCEDWRVMMVVVEAEAATIKNDGYFCRRLDDKEDKQDTWFPKDMEKDMEPHAEEEVNEFPKDGFPKFKVGDKVMFRGEKITINDITNTGYEVMYPEGEGFIGGGLENEMEKVKTKFDEGYDDGYQKGYKAGFDDGIDNNNAVEYYKHSKEYQNAITDAMLVGYQQAAKDGKLPRPLMISSTKEAEEIINFIKDCFNRCRIAFPGADWEYYEKAIEVLRPEYSSYQQGFNAGYSKGYEARIRVEKDIVIGLKEVLDEVNKIKDEDDC